MKVKIFQIKQFMDIYEKIKDTTLPIKVGYKLAKIAAECQKEMDIYQFQLNKIIQEYGARDENNQLIQTDNGNGIKIKEDKIQECQDKLNELSTLEVEINETPISIESLDNLELSLNEIGGMASFLSEE